MNPRRTNVALLLVSSLSLPPSLPRTNIRATLLLLLFYFSVISFLRLWLWASDGGMLEGSARRRRRRCLENVPCGWMVIIAVVLCCCCCCFKRRVRSAKKRRRRRRRIIITERERKEQQPEAGGCNWFKIIPNCPLHSTRLLVYWCRDM